MEREQKVVCRLSKGDIGDELEWPLLESLSTENHHLGQYLDNTAYTTHQANYRDRKKHVWAINLPWYSSEKNVPELFAIKKVYFIRKWKWYKIEVYLLEGLLKVTDS